MCTDMKEAGVEAEEEEVEEEEEVGGSRRSKTRSAAAEIEEEGRKQDVARWRMGCKACQS
jgi:hypothetical protein